MGRKAKETRYHQLVRLFPNVDEDEEQELDDLREQLGYPDPFVDMEEPIDLRVHSVRVEVLKIPVRQRILLYTPQKYGTKFPWLYRFLLQRWAGELPIVYDGRRTHFGFCGHTSFWKRTLARHEHGGAAS